MKFAIDVKAIVAAAALVVIGVSIAIGVAVVLFTGSSEPAPGITIEGVLIGEPVSIELPAREAATVTHESGASIEIPAGATTASTTVSVAEVEPPESEIEVRRAFDFSVGDVELVQPVTIHIPFELETGEDTAAVHALHWNEEAAGWEPVAGTVDESTRTIAVTTSNLSLFSWAWVKVDANCNVSPGTVDVGESFTVTSTGTSLTSGNIKIYMKPDLQGPVDLPDQPEAKSEIAIVGMGEQFQLNVASALEIPAEHLIHCRIFWETIGPDVELTSQESLAALLDVEGEEQFMYRTDLALKAKDIFQFPIYVGERFGIGLEVENLGDQSSIPFDLVAYFTSVVDETVTRVDSIEFGHSQEPAVRAGHGHLPRFEGMTPDDLPTGDYVVCVEIQYSDTSARDFDTSNDRACLDKYVMHKVEGAMSIYTTLTKTKAGHRVWTGVPSGSDLEPEAGLGFADDSGIRDDETLKKLYKRLAAELAFQKAMQPERGEQHVLLRGLMENVKGPAEIVGYINDFCGQLEIGCRTAMENTGLLDSGLMYRFPHVSHEAIGFAGQSISGVLLFGDVYFSMLVNQALGMQQAFDTLDELWLLPLGPVWKEAVEEAREEVAIMDSNRWNAQALEIVNSKDEIGKFAFTATVGGLTKYAVKKQLLHHLGITAQKALAHSFGLKVAGGTAATTGVGGAAAAAGPVLFVASVGFAAEVYSDVQENQDQIGVATLASFLNAAFSHPSHKPELREALAYAKYVAYDNFYKSDEGFLQEIASWITFRPGDHDLFLTYTDVERDKALEEVKALVSVASVEVSPESLTLAVGDRQKLRGVATTVSGSVASSQDFGWSSSAPEIATVSEGGLVTGVAPGEATIAFGVSDIRGIARVTVDIGTELPVEPPPPPSVSDREALIALYHATDGSGWKNNVQDNQPWLIDNTASAIGDWYGVTTFDDKPSRVKYLIVEENCLEGRLPEAIGGLSELQFLILQWNSRLNCDGLTGQIPPSLGNLTNLWELDLSENRLSGTIPDALGNLASLEVLDLSDNRLSGGIPSSLGNLENLYALDLKNNRLEGQIPDMLAELPDLEELYLSGGGNDFTGCIPKALFEVDDNDLAELGLEPCGGISGTTPSIATETTPAATSFARNPAKDFNEPADLGIVNPWGIWSDGTTMWVGFYYEDHKVYAYDMATKARVPSKDFNTLIAAGNHDPRGLWSNGQTMWIADAVDDRIYAYNMTSKARDENKDIYPLDPGNTAVEGIWSNGTTVWASDLVRHKLYAYDMVTKGRVPAADIAANFRPVGLWSDGVTMWVADLDHNKIYAYELASKERDESKEFNTLNAAGNSNPVGIWSNGETMWVMDVDDHKIYAYTMPSGTSVPPRPATVATAAFARNSTKDFDGLASDGMQGVEGIWSDGTTMWVSDEVVGKIFAYDLNTRERVVAKDFDALRAAGNSHPEALWSNGATMWVVDSDEGRGSGKIYSFDIDSKAPVSDKEFNTLKAAGNGLPRGLWSDGATMWAGDDPDGKIYAYDMATKARIPEKDFNTLNAAGNGHPEGLWSDGVTMWVADYDTRKIYAYDMVTKMHLPSKDFNTLDPSGNSNPGGLWSDGRTMWVADVEDGKLYAYNMPPGTRVPPRHEAAEITPQTEIIETGVFTRNPAEDFDGLAVHGNDQPWGLWSDGEIMWVSDERYGCRSGNGKVYAYDMRTKTPVTEKEFNTLAAAGNSCSLGIWSDGATMWVADHVDDRIYAYDLATKVRIPGEDFNLLGSAGNISANGIWSDGSTMWVVDWEDRKIYAYDMETKARVPTEEFNDLEPIEAYAEEGIWSDGVTMWLAQSGADRIYAYDLRTKERVPSRDLGGLATAGNVHPWGIWSDGASIWVADPDADKIYAYTMPSGTGGFP